MVDQPDTEQKEHLTWADLDREQGAKPDPPKAAPAAAPATDYVELAKRVTEGFHELNQLIPQLVAARQGQTAQTAPPDSNGGGPATPATAALVPPGRVAYQHLEALAEHLVEQAPNLRYEQLTALASMGLDMLGGLVPTGKPIGPTLLSYVRTFQPQIEAYMMNVRELQDPVVEPTKPAPRRRKARA